MDDSEAIWSEVAECANFCFSRSGLIMERVPQLRRRSRVRAQFEHIPLCNDEQARRTRLLDWIQLSNPSSETGNKTEGRKQTNKNRLCANGGAYISTDGRVTLPSRPR